MENIPSDDTPLSSDPEEDLRMQNEFLRLKVLAELGTTLQTIENLPPTIENEFLKNILAFESHNARAKRIRVFDLLGRPDFTPCANLNDDNIEKALNSIINLLSEKNIVVDFLGTYENRTKYSFITEELFEHETDDMISIGMTMHFIYEEFHPNHQLDIESRTNEFIAALFKQQLHEQPWTFSKQLIHPSGKTWTKFEMADKLKEAFKTYLGFNGCQHYISNISFDLNLPTGIGYAEGAVKYVAITECQESKQIEGPFKLYFSLEDDWWSIFYFLFPGFEIEDK